MFFLSVAIIFILGFGIGVLFEKIRLPKIIWYIILGILISPSVLGIVNNTLLDISSYLRQIALIVILTRSGLSLDLKSLKSIGKTAIFMCFVPATFEIIGITIFAPLFLGVSYFEAMLMGSVLGAVSPAIVVPRMLKYIDTNYGTKKSIPQLVMAGASCDDIYVIVLFYSFLGLVRTNEFNFTTLFQIPTSIIYGILLGIILGTILSLILKKFSSKLKVSIKVIMMLGVSFLLVGLEEILKDYLSISGLLGVIVIGSILFMFNRDDALKIKNSYNSLWDGFEMILFVLVGCCVDVKYAFSIDGLIILGTICIGLIFRSIGVAISLIGSKFSLKEIIFIICSYLPKATVQASIGGIALAQNLACGEVVLTTAVIAILFTAPLGAILMDLLYKKLLTQDVKLEKVTPDDKVNNIKQIG